jgi:YgiT-type zinc finger domain-containing protein
MMNNSFICPECGQRTADSFTEMTYEVEGSKITLKDIPAQVCPNGHSYIDGFTAENANRLVNHVVEDVNAYAKKLGKQPVRPFEVVIAA